MLCLHMLSFQSYAEQCDISGTPSRGLAPIFLRMSNPAISVCSYLVHFIRFGVGGVAPRSVPICQHPKQEQKFSPESINLPLRIVPRHGEQCTVGKFAMRTFTLFRSFGSPRPCLLRCCHVSQHPTLFGIVQCTSDGLTPSRRRWSQDTCEPAQTFQLGAEFI